MVLGKRRRGSDCEQIRFLSGYGRAWTSNELWLRPVPVKGRSYMHDPDGHLIEVGQLVR
jgi:hypothetical protein